MKLIRAIVNDPWMIDARSLVSYLPLAHRLMRGEQVALSGMDKTLAPYSTTVNGYSRRKVSDAIKGSVAVYPITGLITKFDAECGPPGTQSLVERMRYADDQENIVAHFFEIDSGGGQGTNLESVAQFIRNEIRKPVIAWFNGMAASAAYYLAAAADEVYASEETDLVGSIGVMITFADYRKFYEEAGIQLHEVYADQSDLKNQDFLQALGGEYDLLKQTMLNPYAQRFISTIREMRPELSDEDAFRGKVYAAKDAPTGMIDGLLTYQLAIQRATELGTNPAQDPATNTRTMDNMQNIEALLGYELNASTGDDGQEGAFLRKEELEKINAQLNGDTNSQTLETAATDTGTDNSEIEDRLSQVEATLTTINTTLQSQQALLNRMSGEPGAGPTEVASDGDEQPSMEGSGEGDALAELNAMAAAD